MANTFNVVENFKYPYTINGVIDAWIHKNNDEDLHIAPQSPIIYNIKNNNLLKYYDRENDIIHFPFDALMMFNTSAHHETIDPNIGVGFMSYNIDGNLKLTPIDMVINKTAINDVAQFYNKQSGSYTTGGLLTNYVLTKENIYYIIKYLRMYDEYLIEDTMNQMQSAQSKYYQLYNDKVDNGDFFCEYIYRSTGNIYNMEFKDNDSRVYLYKNGNYEFAKIPVFRVDTKNPNVKFYYVIRNFRIPLKRVLTSTYTYGYGSGAQQMYAFIFICPEYILKQYSEYIDSISYIIGENLGENINKDDYKFSYNYLYTDDNNVNHLWVHNFDNNDEPFNCGLKLANTNSTRSFIN